MSQIKIVVKQEFDDVDAIMFEVALAQNSIDTKHKQRQYAN